MFGILFEVLAPVLRGERSGCRLRIKPSWSGRVYGTYSVSAWHFALAFAFVVSTSALLGRLVALNAATPDLASEAATLRLTHAHQLANRSVAFPQRQSQLADRSESLFAYAHQIETILGVKVETDSRPGLGSMELRDNAAVDDGGGILDQLASEAEILARRFRVLGHELTSQETTLRFTPSVVPFHDAEFVPTSPFGRRFSPFTRRSETHRGIDLAADMFSKITATADGTVIHVERNPRRSGMGIYLMIDHGGQYVSYYAHCSRVLVDIGDTIQRHQVIAEVGSTGRSTGPHVHYEIRRDGVPVNPRDFMLLDPRFQKEVELPFY